MIYFSNGDLLYASLIICFNSACVEPTLPPFLPINILPPFLVIFVIAIFLLNIYYEKKKNYVDGSSSLIGLKLIVIIQLVISAKIVPPL